MSLRNTIAKVELVLAVSSLMFPAPRLEEDCSSVHMPHPLAFSINKSAVGSEFHICRCLQARKD